MKRIWLKRAVSLGLAFTLTAGLSACGGGGGNGENAKLAKEGVYKLQEFDMPEIDGDDYNILNSVHKDGTIQLLVRVYHWSEEGNRDDIRLLNMKEDGSDLQMVPLEIPENPTGSSGIVPTARSIPSAEALPNREDDVQEPDEESGSEGETDPDTESGSEGETDPDAGPDSEGETDSDAGFDSEGERDSEVEDVWENCSYNNFIIGSDGKIYANKSYNYENYSTETYIHKDFITSWSMDGSLQFETDLGELRTDEEYAYINTMTVAEDGTISMILSGDSIYKMTVDAQGNASGKVPLSEDAGKIFNNMDRVINKGDGTFVVLYYDENDWTKEFMVSYDPATDALGEAIQLPSNFNYGGYNILGISDDSELLLCNNSGVYTYKVGTEDVVQKMSFINSDLLIGNFSSLIELDDSTFVGVFYESYDNVMKAGRFTYVDPKDIADKSVLVLAGTYIGGDMKKRVIDYNRASDQYRIVVKNYDSYNSYDDWQAGYTQLNNDVTTGNMPDILLTDGLPVENYIAKGLLADIGKLIQEDEELSQVEFVQNIMDAFSVDGKLHYVIPSFSVRTMIGKSAIVGDRTSWTMADMMQLKDSLPEGTNLIGEMNRSGFFQTMMQFCGSDFIDTSTGKCDFDTQNFIEMMEYAKSLPEELGEDYYGEDYWMNYESQYRDDRTILSGLNINNLRDINYTINGSFGEDVSYIGFPTENGMGSYAMPNECYAISSKSKYTEGAWEFLRYYLTDEYQSTMTWGLPIQKKYFEENAKKALERPFYMDENDNKVEYDDYFYLNGEEIKLDPLSQEQVDEAVAFILSVDKCYYYNESVMNIINEEMEAYFSGQKSAQEVAKIIQNRAQIYVNENR